MNWAQIVTEIKSGGQSKYYAGILFQHPEDIPQLISAISHHKASIAWRAAWILDNYARKDKAGLLPYYSQLSELLISTQHHGVRRHITRILSDADPRIIEDGRVVDRCFDWLIDSKSPVAVKANAMQVIANLCNIYPELTGELKTIIEDGMYTATPGFKSRGKKILSALKKNQELNLKKVIFE